MEELNKSVNIEKNEEEVRFLLEERFVCSDRLEDEEVFVIIMVYIDKDIIKNNSSILESEVLILLVFSWVKFFFFIIDIFFFDKIRVFLLRGDNVLCSDENLYYRFDMYLCVGYLLFNVEFFDEFVKWKYGIKRLYDEIDLVLEFVFFVF